ncbi:MAG: hypothetical protein RMJ44_00735 [Cytophagales bacterium]|nr:hypothetical protein [Bernardetiaceae bacterium]MDW8209585.1 hypothetical protein [Cytophagales bacterium]
MTLHSIALLWKKTVNWTFVPVKGLQFARSLLKNGGHVVETSFVFGKASFTFKTVISFGDIVVFIPDPAGYYAQHQWHDLCQNPHWHACYQKYLQIHFEEIANYFHAIERQIAFWQNSISGFIGIVNIYPLYRALLLGEWFLLFFPIASALYIRFLGKVTARAIALQLWQIAKKWFIPKAALIAKILPKAG